MSSADDSEAEEASSESSYVEPPDFEPPPMQRAALVLCSDSLVRAYDSVASARAAHLAAGAAEHCITEFGAKAKRLECGEHHYTLLVEPSSAEAAPQTVTSALNESLLRTNVQKAVRRKEPAAARASVLQYFAQAPGKGQNEKQKKMLTRLAVMAAEDATTVPLLPTAIFHLVGATSLGADAAHCAANSLADCAAQLAAAPRDQACTDAQAWQPSGGEVLKLIGLQGSHLMLGRERLFDKGWTALDCAQVILIDLAARIVGRHDVLEGQWLFALERAVRGRLANGRPACAGAAHASPPPAVSRQEDGTLLPEAYRFYFSADFHNSERLKTLYERLKGALNDSPKEKDLTKTALKAAMKQQALRNLRDHGLVHRLTMPTAPQGNARFEQRWQEEARALWAAQPLAVGGKKRAGGGGGARPSAADSKQPKLSFGAAS